MVCGSGVLGDDVLLGPPEKRNWKFEMDCRDPRVDPRT